MTDLPEWPPSGYATYASPGVFTARQEIAAPNTGDGLKITSAAYPNANGGAALHIAGPADGSNSGLLLSLDGFGVGNMADYKWFPTNPVGTPGGSALTIHAYRDPGAGQAAVIIDNTDAGAAIKLKNTEGSNNPNGNGRGPFLELYGYMGASPSATADGAIAAGTAVLTSPTANFLSSDVGKPIRVAGAGAAGGNLDTTILSRQSATQVTLAANAATTVAAATFTYPKVGDVNIIGRLTGAPTPFGSRQGALRFINLQTGLSNMNASPWSFENNTDNGAAALQVMQAAGATGATALLVNNLGNTGDLLTLQASGNNKLRVDNNGSLTQVTNVKMTGNTVDGNLIFGTVTGTKIGTSAAQKLAFYNAAPIVQPAGTPAASSDLASVIALANSLRTNLLALGLVA